MQIPWRLVKRFGGFLAASVAVPAIIAAPLTAQEYGEPDREEPGDEAIQAHLQELSAGPMSHLFEGFATAAEWEPLRSRYIEEYFYMLGLSPRPEKTPLHATVTGSLEREGFLVEKLHFQSRPRLYVTGNLYRPAMIAQGQRLPAVLYVCGHSPRGRDGNKTAYQSHGMWFARHGYICLMIDTLQLGEIAGIHHGTYREQRWWWHSRGYTPAGVEAWNGIRAIDYLQGRKDVDPTRIAVTGISGGGAASFWIAAADERIRVAVPVSGMADLPSYVANRVVNGHCDCMFLHNTFAWPWTRIAFLVGPRPLLFVNSDADRIFPMDANERISTALERFYALFGAGHLVDSVVSIGGHAYREDIRRAAYRFINIHLKGDGSPIADSEVDLVTGRGDSATHPIPPGSLRVFPTDADLPADELNTTIDRHFVPVARLELPRGGEFGAWRQGLLTELRRVCFRQFQSDYTAVAERRLGDPTGHITITLEPRSTAADPAAGATPGTRRVLIVATLEDGEDARLDVWGEHLQAGDTRVIVHTRGTGPTRWTRRNPPNYVERSHVLLGRTVDGERVQDVAAAASHWSRKPPDLPGEGTLVAAGRGAAGVIAAYAALLEPSIEAVTIVDPPASHMDPGAPRILNVLRVLDIPDALGLLAPRPLRLVGAPPELVARVRAIYESAGAAARLSVE